MPATPGTLQLGALPAPPTVLSGDFNGDGKLDVARLSQTGLWQVGLSEGRAFSLNPWGHWGPRSNYVALLTGDFTGDGRTDVAGLTRDGDWMVGVSSGQGFDLEKWGHWAGAASWSKFVVGDFNGDGRQDIAGFSRQGAWVVGLSTGAGFVTSTFAQWAPAGNYLGVWVGDFNGDHVTDVVGLGIDGSWTVGLSTGQFFGTQFWGRLPAGIAAADVEVGDFTGDGLDDVATLSTGGLWTVGVSTGGGFNSAAWAQWGTAGGWDDIEVANLTGDNRADLVALGQNGTWGVALSQGNAFATQTWAATGQRIPPGLRLQVGDINGDGLDDAAVFLPSGTWLAGVSDPRGQFLVIDAGSWSLGLDRNPYQGDLAPFADGAPWSPLANRAFITAQPQSELQAMYFNSPGTYQSFVENFYGVLHSWVQEADLLGITDDTRLMPFLAAHLQAEFVGTRSLLASAYPGQNDQTYRLLLAMNLTHAYFPYGAIPHYRGLSLYQTLHLPMGDCTQIADALVGIVRASGVAARELGQVYDFPSPVGPFLANHVVVYAGGLWLDAEINTAFVLDLNQIQQVAPADRLQFLLDNQRVFGFYDWYLQPQVRLNQLAQGQDGGIIAFYYQYYLEGLGNGDTQIHFVRGR